MTLETEARDVLGRTGTWKGGRGPPVGLPLLLETGAGEGAAALLATREPAIEGPLVVRDLGSSLVPLEGGAAWAHLEIPAEPPLPPSLADQLDEVPVVTVDGTGRVEMVHAAASRTGLEPPPPQDVEWVVLASAAVLAGRPDRLVDAVMAARGRAGPGRVLYLPGVATPRNLALLVYMGADAVDDVQCRLEAARGRLLRPELGHLHGPGDLAREELERRNLGLMRHEMELVREAVRHSALRELVEVRARSEPWQVAALRRLDRHHAAQLARYCPVHRDRPMMALTREALWRVEVTSWVDAILERYSPPPSARVLVLLPCSARKPYGQSRTHRRFADAMASVRNRWTVHEVILTSPLGAVPRELERTYPAAHYDIPVSGDWFADEVDRMRLLVEGIRGAGAYDAVISHMGDGLPFLEDDRSVSRTRPGGEGALDAGALERLGELVGEAAAGAATVSARDRKREDVASLARFQFGASAGEALMDGADVQGRPPAVRIVSPDGQQRGMVVPARGRISLTLDGAVLISQLGGGRVWMDDFELRGDLFAVGVTSADPDIRPEEEVLVLRRDEPYAVGLARMSGEEMMAAGRGVAVSVRHRRRGGDQG